MESNLCELSSFSEHESGVVEAPAVKADKRGGSV
jgi:hypothetical protein